MKMNDSTARTLVGLAIAVAPWFFVFVAGPAVCEAADERPNILWISTEDISPDLGCYGDTYAHTPNLDKLAGEGAIFLNVCSHSGVCAPTRSGIITGMYPTTMGTHHMRSKGVPPAGVKCFTEYLRAAGYYCTNAVKTDYNFDSPVTAWDECRRGAHWRNRPEGMPFFCVINLTVTHESQIRCPEKRYQEHIKDLPADVLHDPAKATLPPYYPDTPLTRKDWARYYDLITAMDRQVARIIEDLEDDGLAENTVVFFWGDHGRGLPRAKRWVYDSGIRVPLLVRWPGTIRPATVRDDLVAFLDLAPTVLSIAGVKIPSYMQGQVFLGPHTAPPRTYLFAARDRMDETYDIIRAVRDKRFKYIRNFQPEKPYAQHIAYMDKMPTLKEMRRLHALGKLEGAEKLFFRETKPVEELYDVTVDPHEIHDLAERPQYEEVLTRMRKALADWQEETGDLGLIGEPELKERMRPGGVWQVTDVAEVTPSGGKFSGPLKVTVTCATEGASIAYTTAQGKKKPRWKLYAGELTLHEDAVLRVKACRLGYKDSPVVRADFQIGSR